MPVMTLSCGHERPSPACPACQAHRAAVRKRARKGGRAAPVRPGKAARPIPREVPPCVHRGAALGKVGCQTCKGPAQLVELFACRLKQLCTIDPDRRASAVQRCQTCSESQPPC